LEDKIDFFNKMYDIVRLVDPLKKRVVEYKGSLEATHDEICYSYWKRDEICDNCISIRAYLDKKCYQKLEQLPNTIMIVTAFSIENLETPLVLELLKNVTETMMVGTGNYLEGQLLHDLITKLNGLAVKDELTDIYNRRYINERLPADIVRAVIENSPLSIIFLDIDNFKDINDTYGHEFGDKAITEVTGAIMKCIRAGNDWASRYGGDEFLVCLNRTSEAEAYKIAERIRHGISELTISPQNKIKLTASLGVYTMNGPKLTAAELISCADKRMFEAKQQGGNCTKWTD